MQVKDPIIRVVEALVVAALREHAPFDDMEADALVFLASHLRLAYYARGDLLVGPESGTVERLYVVKQGSVRGGSGAAEVVLGPGECFPLGALVGRRATVCRRPGKARWITGCAPSASRRRGATTRSGTHSPRPSFCSWSWRKPGAMA